MFDSITKEKKLYYFAALVTSIWFFKTVFQVDIGFIVAVIVALFIMFYDNETLKNDTKNDNIDLHYKLVSLLEKENYPTPSYFYLEPDIINFFYDIRDFRIYNRDSYLGAIKHTDTVLKLKSQLRNDYRYAMYQKPGGWQNFGIPDKTKIQYNIKNHKAILESAEQASELAVNYIHSFAVSLPGGIYVDKHKRALDKFHILMKRILDGIHDVCKKSSENPLVGQTYGLVKPSRYKTTSFDFVYI